MKSCIHIQFTSLAFTCLVLLSVPLHAKSIALDSAGETLFVANHDAQSISIVGINRFERLREIPLRAAPDNLLADDAGRIWVTSRLTDQLSIYDVSDGSMINSMETGDQPFDILHIDATYTAVTLFGADEVLLINRTTFAIDRRVSTLPGPRGLTLSPDGLTLYVSHFRIGVLSIVDVGTWSVSKTIQPEADGYLFQNLVVTKDGKRAYLPLTRSNVSNNALLFDTTMFPVVSVIDLENQVALPSERVSLDIADEPVGIPIDAVLTESLLFILNAGSNDLSVIERDTGAGHAHVELGHNPRSMLLSADQSKLYIHNTLSGSVSLLDTQTFIVIDELAVSSSPLPSNILNGKRLFNSSDTSDLSRDQWISCASCHFDGELDSRTWFFPDGPRNTTSLLGVGETLPLHWSGDLDELHDVESTVRKIQAGTGLVQGEDQCTPGCDQAPPNSGRSKDLDDLAAFMATLRLPPNPNLDGNGYLRPAATRGAKVFYSQTTACSGCHVPPLFTDRLRHDVETGGGPGERKGPDFDTPTLRGVFSTAPYLHDGRAATLLEVLTVHNPADQHGVTSALSLQEIDDLVMFLQSLTYEPPIFRTGFETTN